MVNTLQFCIRFLLFLGVIVGIAFMVMCTVLVIISIIHGDIKIVRDETERENRQEK